MSFSNYFPATAWIGRVLTGRVARRVYLAVILLAMIASAAVRIYAFVLTRRIQAVISELSKLEIDKTTEAELLQTVPQLVRGPQEWNWKGNIEYGDLQAGTQRYYYVAISNESNWMKFENFAERFWRPQITPEGELKGGLFQAADLLGYRFVGFAAKVATLDGKVSKVSYGLANRFVLPRQFGDIISVGSFHTQFEPFQTADVVRRSTADENPDFQVEGDESLLAVGFTPDAAPELKSLAFRLNLGCFWALRRCQHAEQLAPELWRQRNAIVAATLTRLQSQDPCPERIIAGRIKRMPDVQVALLEAMESKDASADLTRRQTLGIIGRYKLIEVLRGRHATRWWNEYGVPETILYPGEYKRRMPNPSLRWTKPGNRVIAFERTFDSCSVVPATTTALALVQNGKAAARRAEDMLVRGAL